MARADLPGRGQAEPDAERRGLAPAWYPSPSRRLSRSTDSRRPSRRGCRRGEANARLAWQIMRHSGQFIESWPDCARAYCRPETGIRPVQAERRRGAVPGTNIARAAPEPWQATTTAAAQTA